MLGSVFRPGTQAGLLLLNWQLMCCMTLGKRLLLKEGGGLDPSQGTLFSIPYASQASSVDRVDL